MTATHEQHPVFSLEEQLRDKEDEIYLLKSCIRHWQEEANGMQMMRERTTQLAAQLEAAIKEADEAKDKLHRAQWWYLNQVSSWHRHYQAQVDALASKLRLLTMNCRMPDWLESEGISEGKE